MLETLLTALAANIIIKLVVISVVMDTFFGVLRAIKHRCFNSSIGIDGAIRKISMLVSIAFLAFIDTMVHINLIGFIPEGVRSYLPQSINIIGLAEFFGVLYLCYEVVSILKNMVLCGLPVKKLWEAVRKALGKYTEELPDEEEQVEKVAEATDDVPDGALEETLDGMIKVYDKEGRVVGKITKEQAEILAASVMTVK